MSAIEVPDIDMAAVRRCRLARIRQQLSAHDVSMCVLTNPVSLRYATDFREYQLFGSIRASPAAGSRRW